MFQDRAGRIWVGFNDLGMMLFSGAESRHYTTRDGLPDNDDLSDPRRPRKGDLLVATRSGVARMKDGKFRTYDPPDPLGRKAVFDALEDRRAHSGWRLPAGLSVCAASSFRMWLTGGPLLIDFVVTLSQGQDGAIWAGTYGKGLWRVKGDERRHYTTADGLSSDQIRSLYEDAEGTLWIGTFGGGLNALRDGKFLHYGARDGLLSDNIGKVFDDGESLWLSTTRGICRIAKSQLAEFSAGKRTRLEPRELWRGRRVAQRAVRAGLSDRRRRHPQHRRAACGSPPAAAWRCSIRMRANSRSRFPGGAPGSDDRQWRSGGSQPRGAPGAREPNACRSATPASI